MDLNVPKRMKEGGPYNRRVQDRRDHRDLELKIEKVSDYCRNESRRRKIGSERGVVVMKKKE